MTEGKKGMVFEVASPSLFDDAPRPLRGHLDVFDRENGIEGWALHLEDPYLALSIELLIGEDVIAACDTDRPRSDIAAMVGLDVRPGFRFPDDTFDRISSLAAPNSTEEIVLRIAGTPLALPTARPLPRLSALADAPASSAVKGVAADFELMARLSTLRVQASRVAAEQPLRPLPEHLAGFIEGMATDEGGCVWFVGWMKRSMHVDGPAVIVDGQKTPAGVAFALYDRPDLGADATGVVGILYTNWRPSPGLDTFVYVGDEGRAYLRLLSPLGLVAMRDFQEQYFPLLPTSHTGHGGALQQLMNRPESWAITPRGAGFAATASIDSLLVLPNFGAIVAGWALSPVKTMTTFTLRLGSVILGCDQRSLVRSARPDLAGVMPGADALIAKAGFVGVFRGDVAESDIVNPVLKIHYADGSTSNHAADPPCVRRMGFGGDLNSALVLYPSLTSELFFPDFASALRQNVEAATSLCTPYFVQHSRRVVVFVTPRDKSDLFLLFHEIEYALMGHDDPPGIAFIAEAGNTRPALISLFRAWSRRKGLSLSLFFVEDCSYALYVLPTVLDALRASAFAYVSAGVFPTPQGWLSIGHALISPQPDLTLLETRDAVGEDREARLSSECFIWSSRPFTAWVKRTPFLLGGLDHDASILTASEAMTVVPDAGRRSSVTAPSTLSSAVNSLAPAR